MSTNGQPRALLLVMIAVDPAHEDELNRWYEEEHFPERATCPGFLSARRFIAVEGEPRHLAIYDLENHDVLESPEYRKIYDPPSPWTKRMRELFLNGTRNVYVAIGRPSEPVLSARGLLLVMADVAPDVEDEFNRW